MDKAESISQALAFILMYFKIPPRVVYCDTACNMYSLTLLRIPWLLHITRFEFDRFHYKSHYCNSFLNPDTFRMMDGDSTSAADDVNARIEIKPCPSSALWMVITLCSSWRRVWPFSISPRCTDVIFNVTILRTWICMSTFVNTWRADAWDVEWKATTVWKRAIRLSTTLLTRPRTKRKFIRLVSQRIMSPPKHASGWSRPFPVMSSFVQCLRDERS